MFPSSKLGWVLGAGGQDPQGMVSMPGETEASSSSGRASVKGPVACPPFPQAQQLVGGGVAKETPITMAMGFSWYPIGSLLVRSPSLSQVFLWLLLGGKSVRVWGGEPPFLRQGGMCWVLTPQAWGPPSRAGRRRRVALSQPAGGLCWLNREVGGTHGVFRSFLGKADFPHFL